MNITETKKFKELDDYDKNIVKNYCDGFSCVCEFDNEDDEEITHTIDKALESCVAVGDEDEFCVYILGVLYDIEESDACMLLRFIDTEKMWNEYSVDYQCNGNCFFSL